MNFFLIQMHKINKKYIYNWPLILFGDNRKRRKHTSCLRWEEAGGNKLCLQNENKIGQTHVQPWGYYFYFI